MHSTKGARRYHYYVSEERHHGKASSGMRIPAQAIEKLVIDYLAELCSDALSLAQAVSPSCQPENWQRLNERGLHLAEILRAGNHDDIAPLVASVTVADHSVVIAIHAAAMAEALALSQAPEDPATVEFTASVRLRRSGAVLRLVDGTGAGVGATPNDVLLRLVVQARRFWATLRAERITIGTLAAREGVTASYATRVLRVAFLAPALIETILAGRQSVDLTGVRLLELCEEGNWEQQVLRAGASKSGTRHS